jgi:hypothetical protein
MEQEPVVVIKTVQYVEISYAGQKLCLPAREAVDLIKPLSQLLPDDAGLK